MKRSFQMLAVSSMIAFAACGGAETDSAEQVEPSTQIPASPAPVTPAPDSMAMPDSMTHPDSMVTTTGL